ncbi:electron transfer flavoprotein subunit alpha/FixB family protein [bacterium]|nr:electron transfer flavoprotein subunit alpha/FixB family protein [candidate division CSSED10-310 bacterium]
MAGILVWAETHNNAIRKSTYEAATVGKLLGRPDDDMAAVLINDLDLAQSLGTLGFSKVYTLEGEIFNQYASEAYCEALAVAAEEMHADTIILGATSRGRDISGRLAARLDGVLISDITDIKTDADGIRFVRPMYSGKLLAEIRIDHQPAIITARPNVFASGEYDVIEADIAPLAITDISIKTQVNQALQAAKGVLDIGEADIIVSGGRGVGGPEGFKAIEDLAQALNAAIGASRAAVDSGWIPYKHQIGQTGKVVTPTLYIACGISGAIQHFAGMGSSRFIIAINNDPESPIMKKADFAIVGDLFKIIPVLKEEILKHRS